MKLENIAGEYTRTKYAMYLRKSRADLELEAMGEEETLARHKKMLFNLAAKHNISTDQIEIYHELVSGDSIDERPEMQRLLDDVTERKYAGVLVVEVERLARGNTKDQGEVAEAFQMSETKIITPVKVYDPNDEYDQEYFEFGLFMSRREYKTITRRLKSGKQSSVEEGNYLPSRPPFGFDVVRKGKRDRYLVENPEQSKYVKMIFDWYTEDRKPTSWISDQLTELGVPTIKGGERWNRSTITDILFNEHYIGHVTWGHQLTVKEKDPVTGKIVKKRKSIGEKQLHDGKHKGFISEEQFNKVKTIYGHQAPTKVNHELANMFSGLLVCADCGRAIGLQRYNDPKKINRFHHPFKSSCVKKSIFEPLIYESVVEALKSTISDFTVFMDGNNHTAEIERHNAMIETLESELQKQERMKRKLFESWESEDGTYTRDEFIERKQMYASTIENLKSRIALEKKQSPVAVDYEEKITTLHQIIACINDDSISAKEKNIFMKKFIDKITYDIIDFGVGKGGKPVLEIFLK